MPEDYSKLQVAWRYLSLDSVEFKAAAARHWLRSLEKAAPRIGPCSLGVKMPIDSAVRHAKALEALSAEVGDAAVVVRVVAPETRPFEGRALWDALCSLGLEWGDGDCFHWPTPNPEAGDDALFSVSTSTEPGYFFPEEAITGNIQVEDLGFSFAIARACHPDRILDAMLRAAKYVQRRLSGTLVSDFSDDPVDEAELHAMVEGVVERMKAAGIEPGSDVALQLF